MQQYQLGYKSRGEFTKEAVRHMLRMNEGLI